MKKTEIEKQVLLEIEDRRKNALRVADDNLNYALQNQEFKATYTKVKTIMFDIAKKEFEGNDVSELKQELENLKSKLYQIVEKMGLTRESFKPQFSCNDCKDTGYINNVKCKCFNIAMSNILLTMSGKVGDLPSFETVSLDLFEDNVKNEIGILYNKIKEYSSNLKDTTKKVITIAGKTGVGKTHLAEMAVDQAINKGYYTIYTTATNINNEFLKYHLASVNDKQYILMPYINCDFLVIDDLGTEPMLNNVTEEYLFMVLAERFNKQLNTLITTNLDIEQLRDYYGERVFSRIASQKNALLYEFKGKDLRTSRK